MIAKNCLRSGRQRRITERPAALAEMPVFHASPLLPSLRLAGN